MKQYIYTLRNFCILLLTSFVLPNALFGLLDKDKNEQFEEAFVTFAAPNYFSLLKVLIESIHKFSTRPIIVYGINAEVPLDTNRFPQAITRLINKPENEKIYYQKFNIIIQSNVKYGIYVESDDVVNYCIDDLFQRCRDVESYPLCPIHPNDPRDQRNVMRMLGVNEQTNPYVHGHILFSHSCIPFIEECYEQCLKYGNSIGANWDETILNVMLWKYKIRNHYLPVFDPYFEYLSDYINGRLSMGIEYYMFHGCKNPAQARNILKLLKQNIGKPIKVKKGEY